MDVPDTHFAIYLVPLTRRYQLAVAWPFDAVEISEFAGSQRHSAPTT
jgi:hypothetical protein